MHQNKENIYASIDISLKKINYDKDYLPDIVKNGFKDIDMEFDKWADKPIFKQIALHKEDCLNKTNFIIKDLSFDGFSNKFANILNKKIQNLKNSQIRELNVCKVIPQNKMFQVAKEDNQQTMTLNSDQIALKDKQLNCKSLNSKTLTNHKNLYSNLKIDNKNDSSDSSPTILAFKTAHQVMKQSTQNLKGIYNKEGSLEKRKTLGATSFTRSVKSKFVPPFVGRNELPSHGKCLDPQNFNQNFEEYNRNYEDSMIAPSKNPCPNVDAKLMEMIENEVIEKDLNVTWDDIAGLDFVKGVIKEIIVWPMLRPDIFTGLRRPPKGVLLFGPPGTGKTLIGKCIASNSKATFFNISASVLTSKWIGEGEKTVRALFEVARLRQPSVIFVDEVDSLLSSRSSQGEHESSRRLKTEFLVRLDGLCADSEANDNNRLLVLGATNRPQELDEAARRRFVKRLYVPLPDSGARLLIIKNLLSNQKHSLTTEQLMDLSGGKTQAYSGADMADLCREASLGPIRTLSADSIQTINIEDMRPIMIDDFQRGLTRVRPSVCTDDLDLYEKWNGTYGCQ